jgi:dihydrofolate reductase
MTRFVGYIAMSLDGRIADGDGEIDWLLAYGQPEGGEAEYNAFYASIDAIVMGRATFDYLARRPDWSYGDRPVYVVTRRPLGDAPEGVVAVPDDYVALRSRLQAAGYGTIWVMGGGVVQRAALDARMFDHVRVFIMPLVVGSGPLVFADGELRKLKLDGSRQWSEGIVEVSYTIGDDR